MRIRNYTSSDYQAAFRHYLRSGTRIAYALKALQPTSHYIWRTRGDEKVRSSHAANDGRVFAWNNPPETGHPGVAFGCRRTAEPYYGPFADNLDDDAIEPAYPEILIPIMRLPNLAIVVYRTITDINAGSLTPSQIANLQRFDKKLPKDAKEIRIIRLQAGKVLLRSDVPARNIPGSFARYEKIIDKYGNTVSMTKTTHKAR